MPQFKPLCRDLEVYRVKLTKGARIVFEVAVDYDQQTKSWREMLRLWVCGKPTCTCPITHNSHLSMICISVLQAHH